MYLAILLPIWFIVSYGFGVLWVEELNQLKLGGFKLGFWFAQQGSIYIFEFVLSKHNRISIWVELILNG